MEASTLERRFGELLGGGDGRVIADPDALSAYAGDMTEAHEGRLDLVVKPVTVEEVQAIVRLAQEERVPLTPVVARTNVGGLAIPERGGVVVDLSAMNRIVDLDLDNMIAVVEPGVTFEQMRDTLAARAPDLTISYPLSPIYASVAANFLMDGLGNLSVRHGANGEQIGGLEAVLPTGELIRTGTGAISTAPWVSRAPLPDLSGLFLNFQGTTGIVTKLAVQLWPKPAFGKRLFITTEDMAGSFALVRDLARAEVCRDLGGISWPAGKMLFGVERPLERAPGDPEFFVYCDLGGNDERELHEYERIVRGALRRATDRGLPVISSLSIEDLIRVAPSFGRFADFPMTLDFLLDHPGGGLTWVGTYGPTKRWEEGATRCSRLMVERGFPPLIVSRPMKGGHFGVLRMVECFDKRNADEVERVRELNRDLLAICLELGFVPYKTPNWGWEQMRDRTDPGFLDLLARIKSTLDPAGIMNPGKLGL